MPGKGVTAFTTAASVSARSGETRANSRNGSVSGS
jgi:hypothetical protein